MNGNMTGVVDVDGVDEATAVTRLLAEATLSPGNNEVEVSSPVTFEFDHAVQLQNQSQAQSTARNFALEHRIFLRAIMDLLTERDQLAAEANANSPNIAKTGTLKKASHRMKGRWNSKHVEIRKGTFSYFEENAKQRHNIVRKDISLNASSCTCRAVKLRSVKILPGNSGGAVFELKIKGSPRRLWMASSKEERQTWILAIHNAMIGASVHRGDNFLEYQVGNGNGRSQKTKSNVPVDSPYKSSLDQYVNVREASLLAKSRDEYLSAISRLRGKLITVPVQWIQSQLDSAVAAASFIETEISSSVEQLWKDLLRDSVEINGEVLHGESFHGPDRIVGKLTRNILSLDELLHANSTADPKQSRITETQAVTYARDILLACDRTRSGGDSYFCAENLFLNRDLVVLVPSSTEASPLSIKVSSCQRRVLDTNDVSGWVSARSSSDKPWKRQYLVLSNSMLSCYAKAEPKPHELVEHIELRGAKVGKLQQAEYTSVSPSNEFATEHVVNITTKDGRLVREFLFKDEFDSLLWHASMLKAACSTGESEKINGTKSTRGLHNLSSAAFIETSSVVDAVVNVCTEYKLCTLDPSGIESEDTWAELRTTFVQKMTLTGGPDGRISRGEEVVQLEML